MFILWCIPIFFREDTMALVIGLNGGSSFDGIDVVLVEITNGPDGYPARSLFINGNAYAWPVGPNRLTVR